MQAGDMPSASKPAAAVPTADRPMADRGAQLINQLRIVSRITTAFSSALGVDDVYSILLSGLLSPLGLGFSHAMLFELEPHSDVFAGRFSIGYESPEQQTELAAELQSEAAFLEQRQADLRQRAETDESAIDELRLLEQGSHWVMVFQRLGTDSPASREIGRMRFRPIDNGHSPAAGHDCRTLFDCALHATCARLFGGAGGEPARVPAALAPMIVEPFALLPLRTSKGLRSVLLLDRRHAPHAIAADELEALDWFATQGALALQNAELIRDLEQAYQELKTVDQLKSNFLSTVSHELRTPLTAMTGFIDLLLACKAGPITESQRNLLGRVSKNTGHLNNMVNDLIEIAEIEAEGMRDLQLAPVDPLLTLFATLPRLEFRRRDHKVQIEPMFEGVVPMVLTDDRALERIYFHLLDNAVKFQTIDEPIEVRFRTDGDRLHIDICDRGVGIPPDKLARIFDQFYQVDNSLTRGQEGLGIGLAVTKMLVQATHGQIGVQSSVGKGSMFTITYPIAHNAFDDDAPETMT